MWRVLAISVCIASIPGAAHAQAAIAGTVRDAFGSPIPGVTIEAGSSALIETGTAAATLDWLRQFEPTAYGDVYAVLH